MDEHDEISSESSCKRRKSVKKEGVALPNVIIEADIEMTSIDENCVSDNALPKEKNINNNNNGDTNISLITDLLQTDDDFDEKSNDKAMATSKSEEKSLNIPKPLQNDNIVEKHGFSASSNVIEEQIVMPENKIPTTTTNAVEDGTMGDGCDEAAGSATTIRRSIRNRSRIYRRSNAGASSPNSSDTPTTVAAADAVVASSSVNSNEMVSPESLLTTANRENHVSNSSLSDAEPLSELEDNESHRNRSLLNITTSDSDGDSDNESQRNQLNLLNITDHTSDSNSDSLNDLSPDDEDINDLNADAYHSDDESDTLNEVLNKPKPNYTWNITYELMRREHGLAGNGCSSLRNGMSPGFNTRFYASRHVVERMKLSHCLRKHSGCVNCLNFNPTGDLLCTGSDDTRIIIWDWAKNKPKHVFKSGHTENIFQTKFLNSGGSLDIVSASRDGQVRLSVIPPSGGKIETSCLYKHRGSVHKLVLCPQAPLEIISVGEDGYIRQLDLRSGKSASDMLKVVSGSKKNKRVRLFSISHHPFAPEICVCGCDNFVRVYDKRNMSKTLHEMCPEHLVDTSIPQVTCAVYNNAGTEVLASYSDDHIYLFNNKVYKTGEYLHRYRGHYNHRTIKGVNFFGPNSEYVVSGSDCGNIFFWDKNTEAILNFMPGDTIGVVNCLEPHPSIPVLATSGLDHNIKIWVPNSEIYPPDLSKLETCVKRNLKRSVVDETNEFNDRQFHYFIRQFLRTPRGAQNDSNDDDSNSDTADELAWSSSSSSSSSSNNSTTPMEGIHCRTQ